MRKPRDIDAELKALADKARGLKAERILQLGKWSPSPEPMRSILRRSQARYWPRCRERSPATRRRDGAARGPGSFNGARARSAALPERMRVTLRALRRSDQATRRADAALARTDARTWMIARRQRTRQIIELGGLVAKAGLVERTGDDRALIYGAQLALADMLAGEGGPQLRELWRRRGARAFEAEKLDVAND